MTDKEIYDECKLVWVEKSTWGWTFDEFFSLLGRFAPEEEVTLKNGSIITGYLISYWFNDWQSFSHGWVCAYEHLGKRESKNSKKE